MHVTKYHQLKTGGGAKNDEIGNFRAFKCDIFKNDMAVVHISFIMAKNVSSNIDANTDEQRLQVQI